MKSSGQITPDSPQRIRRFHAFAAECAAMGATVRPAVVGRGVEAQVRMVRPNTTSTTLHVRCRRVRDMAAMVETLRRDIAEMASDGYTIDLCGVVTAYPGMAYRTDVVLPSSLTP